MQYTGGCHCGDLRWQLVCGRTLTELGLRRCTCAFCAAHAACYTSDPAGLLRFAARAPDRVQRYRFATRSADFLICGRCGVYVGALMGEDGRWLAVPNLRTLDGGAPADLPVHDMDYGGEDLVARLGRRGARWTPSADLTVL